MGKKKPFDSQIIYCLNCKHIWELICDFRLITDIEFVNWIDEVTIEHEQTCKN